MFEWMYGWMYGCKYVNMYVNKVTLQEENIQNPRWGVLFAFQFQSPVRLLSLAWVRSRVERVFSEGHVTS